MRPVRGAQSAENAAPQTGAQCARRLRGDE